MMIGKKSSRGRQGLKSAFLAAVLWATCRCSSNKRTDDFQGEDKALGKKMEGQGLNLKMERESVQTSGHTGHSREI